MNLPTFIKVPLRDAITTDGTTLHTIQVRTISTIYIGI